MENQNYSQRSAVAAAKAAREFSNPAPQSEISELEDSETNHNSISTLPEEELKKMDFNEQKDRFDRELDELEAQLNRKIKKNQKYLMTIDSQKKRDTNTIQSESIQQATISGVEVDSKPKPNKEFLTRLQYLEKRLERELKESNMKSKKDRREEFNQNISAVNNKKERKWIRTRGKSHVLRFSDEEITKLKECFGALDDDDGGSIGLDELTEPLIGLGFADEQDEVETMIQAVDDDGSNQIEFEEFLLIIKGKSGDAKTEKIKKFFKDMTNGEVGNQDLSFYVNV